MIPGALLLDAASRRSPGREAAVLVRRTTNFCASCGRARALDLRWQGSPAAP